MPRQRKWIHAVMAAERAALLEMSCEPIAQFGTGPCTRNTWRAGNRTEARSTWSVAVLADLEGENVFENEGGSKRSPPHKMR